MMEPLPPRVLRRISDPAQVPYPTTDEAGDHVQFVGQARALEAVRFGVGIRRDGYNLFAIGPEGTGKRTLIQRALELRAASQPPPSDWCYVHNFDDPRRPRAIRLPAGHGAVLRRDLDRALEQIRVLLPALFDGDEYRTRRLAIAREHKAKRSRAFGELQARARAGGAALEVTDTGFSLTPIKDGVVLTPDDFEKLPEDEQRRLVAAMEELGPEIRKFQLAAHEWDHELHDAVEALDRDLTERLVKRSLEALREAHRDRPPVLAHLDAVEEHLVENRGDLLAPGGRGVEAALREMFGHGEAPSPLRRCRVNLLVGHDAGATAPIVVEDHPTHPQLVGRIEHVAELGALHTDFTLLAAGALHRANGGYLLIDALRLLQHRFAWDALKRALRTRVLRFEDPAHELGLVSTVTLEPEPIPLDVKIVLLGERPLYYLLSALDPEVEELFKVVVDFEDAVDRSPAQVTEYATLIADLVRREQLAPFDRGAVARVLDQAARSAEDATKLSVRMRTILDLLREADHFAREAGRTTVTAADVQTSIDAGQRRAGRLRDRLLEQIKRRTLLIDTQGAKVGQVNGLSVARIGALELGHPVRITARVRVGKGDLVDIEREVELGGPIHSKGVLILGGYLGARYRTRVPLSLHASLVFEQSYGGVEGDSASLAELCALLSALADVPLSQAIAVTGSVNQHGEVQPVGGVNEKIEGFFDACRETGFAKGQGVVIPRGNVEQLMLREDVVAAAAAGTFSIWAVSTVDEAIELLTGLPAGAADAEGRLASGSVNRRVEDKLIALANEARAFIQK